MAELADARDLGSRSLQSIGSSPIIRTNHRLAATAAQRDDEGSECGHEPDKRVNQQCEINIGHGFSPQFVRLNWRDVSEGKSRFQKHHGKGRAAPRTRDEAAQAQRGSESPWTLCGTG